MDNMNLNKHISGQFNAELENVRNQVLVMGGLVEQQLTDAISAIHIQDLDAARKIVANDHKVNAMEVAIDEECTRIIAKRQPTAVTVTLTIDANGPSASPTYYADWLTNGAKTLLIGFQVAAGKSWALALPCCYYTGKRPTQVAVDDLNRVTFTLKASTDVAESSSELARSAMKLGLA